MEINSTLPAWLDENHPNFIRWKRARELSIERGKFVYSLISQFKECKNLKVLDLGSGEGGTSKVFSQDNFVISFDLSLVRLQRQKENVIPKESSTEESVFIEGERSLILSKITQSRLVNGNATKLPFLNSSFDLIIVQDVIEHLSETKPFLAEIKRILKPHGTVYLSTPNKLSLFNFFSDPHFGLLFISVFKRETIKKYFLKYFRKKDFNRNDIAQLLSLAKIQNLLGKAFEVELNTKFSVTELFNGNKGIVWSNFHLRLIKFIRLLRLDMLIKKMANNKIGIINKYFTPTFYLILKKKS